MGIRSGKLSKEKRMRRTYKSVKYRGYRIDFKDVGNWIYAKAPLLMTTDVAGGKNKTEALANAKKSITKFLKIRNK